MERFLEDVLRSDTYELGNISYNGVELEFEVGNLGNISNKTAGKSILCQETNPYLLEGDGWLPNNILIAENWVYVTLCVFLSFLFPLASCANLALMATLAKFSAELQATDYIMISLAASDLIRTLVRTLVTTATNAAGYMYLGKTDCQRDGFVVGISNVAGILSVLLLCLERCANVCKPGNVAPTNEEGQVEKKFDVKQARLAIAVCWLFSILWNVLLLTYSDSYVPEGVGTHCAPNWNAPEPGSQQILILLYNLCCLFLPMIAILILCGKLSASVKQAPPNQSETILSNPEPSVTKSVLLIALTFFFLWMPYIAIALFSLLDSKFDPGVVTVTAYFTFPSMFCGPIIYLMLNAKIRDWFIRCIFKDTNPWIERDMDGQTSTMSTRSMVSSKKT